MPSSQSMLQPVVFWVAGGKVVAVQACVNILFTHPAAYWYKWVRKRTKASYLVQVFRGLQRKKRFRRGGHVVMTKVIWSKYFEVYSGRKDSGEGGML